MTLIPLGMDLKGWEIGDQEANEEGLGRRDQWDQLDQWAPWDLRALWAPEAGMVPPGHSRQRDWVNSLP